MNGGTPQTLIQAIAKAGKAIGQEYSDEDLEIFRVHIKDFIAQKFGVAILEFDLPGREDARADSLMDLFEICTKES